MNETTDTISTDDIVGIVRGIAADEGCYTITETPGLFAVHIDGRSMGVVTAPGHSVALYFAWKGGPGLTVRDFTDGERALCVALDWLYRHEGAHHVTA